MSFYRAPQGRPICSPPSDNSNEPAPVYKRTVLAPLFYGARRHYLASFRSIDRAHCVMLAETGILARADAAEPLAAAEQLVLQQELLLAFLVLHQLGRAGVEFWIEILVPQGEGFEDVPIGIDDVVGAGHFSSTPASSDHSSLTVDLLTGLPARRYQ